MKRIIGNILKLLTRAEKKQLAFLTCGNLLIGLADIASLALMLLVISFYAQQGIPKWSGVLPGWLLDRNSIGLVLLFFLFFSIKNYFAWLLHRAQCRFMASVACRISESRLLKYLEGSYSDYVETDSAIFIRKISYQPLEVCQYILDGLQQIVMQSALIMLAVAGVLIFDARLFFLLLIILLPPVFIVLFLIKKRMRVVRLNTKAASEKSLQYLQEALSGFVESNIYGKHDFFLARYMRRQREFNRYLSDSLIVQGMPNRIIEVFALMGLFILVVINKWTGAVNGTTIITIGAFMAAAYKIIPGIVKILNVSSQMSTYAFTLQELTQNGHAIEHKHPSTVQHKTIRSITMCGVSFHFGRHKVLNNFNLSLEAGAFMGICGPSGMGKTTILNLLTGFLEPDHGRIMINGVATGSSNRQQYWKSMAYVKQQPFLMHDSILQNIVMAESATIDQIKLDRALNAAGINEMMQHFPEGLNKLITENGRNISGGQRQRIAIARTIYKDADLILLDEPFNELDEESEKRLLLEFRKLANDGKMIVLITHNTNSLSYCDKIISLDNESINA